MALSRCGTVLATGLLLLGTRVALAQSNSNSPSTYDQMQAAAQQSKAAQDDADAKAAKKKHNKSDESPAVTGDPAAPAPVAADAAAPAAETPAAAPAGGAISAEASAPGTPVVAEGTVAADGKDGDASKDPKAAAAKPVYDKHGKLVKAKVKKEKPPKLVPVDIVHGELTVDGLIAKAGLNFQIVDLKYLYVWVPGLGTVVMSNQPFAGAKLQADAVDGPTLTVKVDGHQVQLACDGPMLDREAKKKLFEGKKKEKATSLYVALDPNYQLASNYPQFGYGDQNKAPYNWPGVLTDTKPNTRAPALPDNLRQKQQIVKLCAKNPDGSQGNCHEQEVPLVLGKKS
jgi:hypothetical protein